jgi:tyrosyl-tRNA synthetase
MQGYDAYSLKADVQVGGTDQFFNIVTASRKIMTALGSQPNIAICLGILPGTDGSEKMSKSMGNHVPITTTPNDLFGKIMSIPDDSMPIYMRLVTRWSPEKITTTENQLKNEELHPRDAKMALAFEVTSAFYGDGNAEEAKNDFIQKFQKNEIPESISEFKLPVNAQCLNILVESGLVSSNSEARRMIKQNAVKLDGVTITDWNMELKPGVLQVGKRKFRKLI